MQGVAQDDYYDDDDDDDKVGMVETAGVGTILLPYGESKHVICSTKTTTIHKTFRTGVCRSYRTSGVTRYTRPFRSTPVHLARTYLCPRTSLHCTETSLPPTMAIFYVGAPMSMNMVAEYLIVSLLTLPDLHVIVPAAA